LFAIVSGRSTVRPKGLIDANAIVAIVDAKDDWHRRCHDALNGLPIPLATSAGVLAEVFHLLATHEIERAWRFLTSGIVTLLPIGDVDAPDLQRLMLKYADRPMDFADATLVRLAEREGLTTILTVDRDFEVYRIGGRKAFRVLPKR
jgi:predicted nucleic acid-binding protein